MAPLFLLTMLCLTPFLVAAHTENFNFVENLARQADVNLDLTGKQSYAIYETIPDTGLNKAFPFYPRRGLVNGRVNCDQNENCDFVGTVFQMDTGGGLERYVLGGRTSARRVETAWKPNHDYNRETKTYEKTKKPNSYKWAGPTKPYTDEEILGFGMYILFSTTGYTLSVDKSNDNNSFHLI